MGEIQKHQRRSIRLPGYDYASMGEYFVTINTYHHHPIFGNIVNGKVKLSNPGEIASRVWLETPNHFSNLELGPFIVMPNHFHAIITINADQGRGTAQGARQGMLCPYRRG
jgi:REP element-mobilizing transposase RayT